MTDQVLTPILTVLFCVLPILIITVVSVVLGDMYRQRRADRIMVGIREGKFIDVPTSLARRIRGLLLLSLISLVGFSITLLLALVKILPLNSKWTIAVGILFLLVGLIAGLLRNKLVMDRAKK